MCSLWRFNIFLMFTSDISFMLPIIFSDESKWLFTLMFSIMVLNTIIHTVPVEISHKALSLLYRGVCCIWVTRNIISYHAWNPEILYLNFGLIKTKSKDVCVILTLTFHQTNSFLPSSWCLTPSQGHIWLHFTVVKCYPKITYKIHKIYLQYSDHHIAKIEFIYLRWFWGEISPHSFSNSFYLVSHIFFICETEWKSLLEYFCFVKSSEKYFLGNFFVCVKKSGKSSNSFSFCYIEWKMFRIL